MTKISKKSSEGNKILCRNIKQARLNMHVSQQQAAEMLGMSMLHYGRLERGERRASLEQIENVARVFRVSPYTLIDGCFKDYSPHLHQTGSAEISDRLNVLFAHCTPEEEALCCDICERIIRGK